MKPIEILILSITYEPSERGTRVGKLLQAGAKACLRRVEKIEMACWTCVIYAFLEPVLTFRFFVIPETVLRWLERLFLSELNTLSRVCKAINAPAALISWKDTGKNRDPFC
jgi:hypothetical protein